jgi:AcrR family transcriptional regulator
MSILLVNVVVLASRRRHRVGWRSNVLRDNATHAVPPVPRVTAAHEQEVRERIIAAALRVFGDRGYHGATIADVVRESGLSVGAIYTYFKGKDDLFLATCDLASGRGLGELAARLPAGRTVAERLAIAVGFYFDSAEGEVSTGSGDADFLVQAWAQAEDPAVGEMLRRRRDQLVMAGTFLIEEGIARGELPRWVDASAMARAYVALLDGMLLVRVEQGPAFRRADAERQAREMLAVILAAAGSPARPDVPEIAPRPFSILEPGEQAAGGVAG